MVGKTLDTDGDGSVDNREAYVYDGQNLILQFSGTGSNAMTNANLAKRFLDGPAVDQLLAEEHVHYDSLSQQIVSDAVDWLLTDNQGTVRDVAVYSSGVTSIADHLAYDSYGNILSQTNSANQPFFTYTGKHLDAATGLYYYNARWYDSATGKFIGQDPLGFAAGDMNLYRYCGNNPVNYTDPTGCSGGDGGWAGHNVGARFLLEAENHASQMGRTLRNKSDELANTAWTQAQHAPTSSPYNTLGSDYLHYFPNGVRAGTTFVAVCYGGLFIAGTVAGTGFLGFAVWVETDIATKYAVIDYRPRSLLCTLSNIEKCPKNEGEVNILSIFQPLKSLAIKHNMRKTP
jgi:RHS repeat-associated protein